MNQVNKGQGNTGQFTLDLLTTFVNEAVEVCELLTRIDRGDSQPPDALPARAAGTRKTNARDRVVDIHALRHTFGTHLSAVGVHPRVAMAAMRHSRIELTMNLYTDPALLDVAGAVNSLPAFGTRFATVGGDRLLRIRIQADLQTQPSWAVDASAKATDHPNQPQA